MKVIFIAYADSSMAYSLKRIGRQAKRLALFDEIILWTPEMLPDYVKDSPLMKYKRGGGYWAWKPAIIWETLQSHEDGDIVVYVDAGCTLRNSFVWKSLFSLMNKFDTICFQYDESVPLFVKWGQTSTKIKYWTKKTALDFFDDYFGDSSYQDYCKILGGLFFVKGRDNQFIDKWNDISISHPELIVDPDENEIQKQNVGFAYHKNDQSLITALAYYDKNILALPESLEMYTSDSFVWASRIRAKTYAQFAGWKLKFLIRRLFGDKFIDRCHRLLRK